MNIIFFFLLHSWKIRHFFRCYLRLNVLKSLKNGGLTLQRNHRSFVVGMNEPPLCYHLMVSIDVVY
jgi:hypothetical protein